MIRLVWLSSAWGLYPVFISHQVDFAKHLAARVFGLIMIPLFLYTTMFAVHFVILNRRYVEVSVLLLSWIVLSHAENFKQPLFLRSCVVVQETGSSARLFSLAWLETTCTTPPCQNVSVFVSLLSRYFNQSCVTYWFSFLKPKLRCQTLFLQICFELWV